MKAAYNGHLKTVRDLIKKGRAKINECNNEGETPLILASEQGHLRIVKYLIKKGADVNETYSSKTALLAAACNGHKDVVQCLIENGADPDVVDKEDQSTALIMTCYGSHKKVAKYLINKIKAKEIDRKNKRGETALMVASQNGHAEIVALLKKNGAKN